MRSLLRVVAHVHPQHPLEMPKSVEEDVVQAFRADGSHEPFRERVGPRCPDRRADDRLVIFTAMLAVRGPGEGATALAARLFDILQGATQYLSSVRATASNLLSSSRVRPSAAAVAASESTCSGRLERSRTPMQRRNELEIELLRAKDVGPRFSPSLRVALIDVATVS